VTLLVFKVVTGRHDALLTTFWKPSGKSFFLEPCSGTLSHDLQSPRQVYPNLHERRCSQLLIPTSYVLLIAESIADRLLATPVVRVRRFPLSCLWTACPNAVRPPPPISCLPESVQTKSYTHLLLTASCPPHAYTDVSTSFRRRFIRFGAELNVKSLIHGYVRRTRLGTLT